MLSQRLPFPRGGLSRLNQWSHTAIPPLSPTGTWDGDIHMPNESRMVVDEYAKVDAIPIGDHSPNAVHAFADCG